MGRLIAVLLLALTAGCATTPPPAPADVMAPWSAAWTLQGRIGVQCGRAEPVGEYPLAAPG